MMRRAKLNKNKKLKLGIKDIKLDMEMEKEAKEEYLNFYKKSKEAETLLDVKTLLEELSVYEAKIEPKRGGSPTGRTSTRPREASAIRQVLTQKAEWIAKRRGALDATEARGVDMVLQNKMKSDPELSSKWESWKATAEFSDKDSLKQKAIAEMAEIRVKALAYHLAETVPGLSPAMLAGDSSIWVYEPTDLLDIDGNVVVHEGNVVQGLVLNAQLSRANLNAKVKEYGALAKLSSTRTDTGGISTDTTTVYTDKSGNELINPPNADARVKAGEIKIKTTHTERKRSPAGFPGAQTDARYSSFPNKAAQDAALSIDPSLKGFWDTQDREETHARRGERKQAGGIGLPGGGMPLEDPFAPEPEAAKPEFRARLEGTGQGEIDWGREELRRQAPFPDTPEQKTAPVIREDILTPELKDEWQKLSDKQQVSAIKTNLPKDVHPVVPKALQIIKNWADWAESDPDAANALSELAFLSHKPDVPLAERLKVSPEPINAMGRTLDALVAEENEKHPDLKRTLDELEKEQKESKDKSDLKSYNRFTRQAKENKSKGLDVFGFRTETPAEREAADEAWKTVVKLLQPGPSGSQYRESDKEKVKKEKGREQNKAMKAAQDAMKKLSPEDREYWREVLFGHPTDAPPRPPIKPDWEPLEDDGQPPRIPDPTKK